MKRRCPGESCNHDEYEDDSARTLAPQPYCPACMKEMFVPAPYIDGSGDEYVEDY